MIDLFVMSSRSCDNDLRLNLPIILSKLNLTTISVTSLYCERLGRILKCVNSYLTA